MILIHLLACTDITFALHPETARVATPAPDSGWDSGWDSGGWDSGGWGDSGGDSGDIGEAVGSFGDETVYSLTSVVTYIRTGDVNGDGRTDIVFTGSDDNGWTMGDRSVYLGVGLQGEDGSITFSEALLDVTSGVRAYLDVGDVNGDGYDDAVVGHFTGWTVFYGDSDGSLSTRDDYSASWTSALDLGDLDDDGDLDLAVLNSDLQAVTYSNDDGEFTESDRWTPDWYYSGDWDYSDLEIRDVDNDGHADLVAELPWQYTGGPLLTVYLGSSGGLDHTGTDEALSAYAQPYQVTLGDFDSDGDTDVLTGEYYPYYAIGGASWTGSHFGSTMAWESAIMAPYMFQAGDVDGDGDDDLLASSGFDVEVLTQEDGELQSSGIYDATTVLAGSVATMVTALGDMNSDGCMDVISQRYPEGLVVIDFNCAADEGGEDTADTGGEGEAEGEGEDTADTGEPAARPKSGFCATSPQGAGWGALVALGVALGARSGARRRR